MFAINLFYCLFLINYIVIIECSYVNKYCGRNFCNDTKQHTLCKFQSEDPARHCIDYEITFKTRKEKQAILDKLNSRRNKVASGEIKSLPPAERMMKLEWNDDLALSAQRWANQCVKHHIPDIKDTCRDLEAMEVGQNIATIYGEAPGLTPVALVDVWYMELLNFNSSVLASYQPPSETRFSHYDYFTQLVWADSTQVGCGGVKFKEKIQGSTDGKNRWIYRLICNFAPRGNLRNHSVYNEGEPCSGCEEGNCDTTYKSLCNPVQDIDKTILDKQYLINDEDSNDTIGNEVITETTKSTENQTQPENVEEEKTTTNKDEDITPFDYFSHLHQFTPQMLTPSQSVICKDVLAVDDFVDLLKKKLSTDPIFKDLMQTTKMPSFNDASYGDATVAALVSRLYSKKSPLTTTKSTDKEHLNSTLLVNLVEAVIFRKEKTRFPTATEFKTDFDIDVSPVKIQAEFAEIRQNADFTGHYFFPEDEETTSESTADTPDMYYDTSNIPMVDVMKEIEDFKRMKATKDFLDEILDTDPATESSTTTRWVFNVDNQKKQNNILKILRAEKKRNKRKNYNKNLNCDYNDCNNIGNAPKKNIKKDWIKACSDVNNEIQYVDLLKKLADDLKILKLNERFHCSRNSSTTCSFYNFFRYLIVLVAILEKIHIACIVNLG